MNDQEIKEIDMLDQLTVENAMELYDTYNSDTFKVMREKITSYSNDHNIQWGIDTLRFAFYKWQNKQHYINNNTFIVDH